MKILHLVGGEITGGAAKGAYLLHKGLLKYGNESRILTNSRVTYNDPTIESIAQTKKQKIIKKIRSELDFLPILFYKKRRKVGFSTALFGYDFTNHPLYKWADIINLHWINGGFISLRSISEVRKPIIWTMRDMWPMTGGCHYSLSCENYINGCGYCKQLGSNTKYDLSRYIIRQKKKYIPKNITLVGISSWISNCAKKSYLFKNYNIKMIHNNIDCYNEFIPIEKNFAKHVLELQNKKKIILAGAKSLNSFYKGFDEFLKSLETINDKSKYYLLFFGKLDENLIKNIGFDYKNIGYLNDILSLRIAYSAADVFVAPSIMEAFGKTIAEAMACGTPTVAFNATGPKDIIDHKINGYLAEPFDTSDLAKGIEWVLEDENRLSELEDNAREKVVKCFDINKVAKQYIKLYEEVLKENKASYK